jgi:hypothetical protein
MIIGRSSDGLRQTPFFTLLGEAWTHRRFAGEAIAHGGLRLMFVYGFVFWSAHSYNI